MIFLKKIISIVSAVILSVSALSLNVSAERNENSKYEFVSRLGITYGIGKSQDEPLTRAEFTAMAVRMINLNDVSGVEAAFNDVSKDSPFFDEINIAKSLRISNGIAEGIFSPDELISYNAAVKEIVVALGYEGKAESGGGYPYGYISIANDLRLTKNTSKNDDDSLSLGSAVNMIYNGLHSEVFGEDDETYKKGRKAISVFFGLNEISGVVSSVGYMSDTDYSAGKNKIEINAVTLNCDFCSEDMFGKKITLWVDGDNNVITADENAVNSEVRIDTEDIIRFSDNTLVVSEDAKAEKSYKFDKGFAYIKNGRVTSHTQSDFLGKIGSARLIDNNGDGKYDYYVAELKQYFVVDSKSLSDKTVYDKNFDKKTIDLTENNDNSVTVLKYDLQTKTYSAGGFNDIAEGNVIEYMQSDDKKVLKVIVSDAGELSGKVEEIRDDEIVVNNNTYKLNYYFKDRKNVLSFSVEYTFLLAPDGTVTDVKSVSKNDVKYGLILGSKINKNIGNDVNVKLLSENGKREVFSLADKLTVDGERKDKNSDNVKNILKNGDFPSYSLIRYSLNSAGEISMIDTEEFKQLEQTVETNNNTDNSLTCYSDKAYIRYKTSGNVAIPNYILSRSTIFMVPTELASNQQKEYDESCFKIVAAFELTNDKEYRLSAYDLDESFYPRATVVYGASSDPDELETPDEYTTSFMVSGVTDALNDEYVKVKKIYGVRNGKYVEYICTSEVLSKLTAADKLPKKGDIVRAVISGGKIIGLSRDVIFSDTGFDINYDKDGVSSSANSVTSYISGTLISKDKDSIVLLADKTPIPNSGGYINKIAPVSLSNPTYTVFDTKTGDIYPGKYENLSVSGERVQYIVCKLSYYRADTVFIYIK